MKGPFCSVNANTDEGFRKITKRRLAISVVLVIAGILILVINEYTRHAGITKVPEFYQGMFSGMGAGLIGAGIAQIIRYIKLLKDEAKLKEARISEEPQATKNLRISLTYKVKSVRRSFDSLTLAQDDTPN